MKILMFPHGGSLNRGCEAIVRTTVSLIKEKHPNAVVHLASKNPEADRIIPMLDEVFLDFHAPIRRFSFHWFISAIKVKVFKDETYAFRKIHQVIIKKIDDYDVFLSIGGDNYCYGEQPGIYEIDRCIKKANKKLILWGASIGEEDLSLPKIEDLKLFDLVLARESLTYNLFKSHNFSNVALVADGAFLLEKEYLPLPNGWQKGNTIGFNYSPLVWKRNSHSKQAAIKLIEHILQSTSCTIAFTPHVIQPNNDDYEVLLEFYKHFKDTGRVLILPNNLNALQYKGYISRMRFFIGARTHATIAAYSTLVPTMVLGYSAKSKGIAIDIFGEEKLVLNLNEISDSVLLINKFNELLQEEEFLKVVLKNKIPEIKEMAKNAVSFL